jgi:hypothetical protein
MVTAHTSVTISWNMRAPSRGPATSANVTQTAIVRAVNGTRVLMRLPDGTTHIYVATPHQAQMLQRLVGTAVEFRLAGSSRQ